MLDNRRHMRIREITDVRWTVLGSELLGEGKILNISFSGMLLQMDKNYDPHIRGKLYVDAPGAEPLAFGPKKGRVVWTKRIDSTNGFQCGLEFDRDMPFDKPLDQWIDKKSDEIALTTNANILNHFV